MERSLAVLSTHSEYAAIRSGAQLLCLKTLQLNYLRTEVYRGSLYARESKLVHS